MSTEGHWEAKRALFERRLRIEHPEWTVTLARVAELPPYRYAVWVSDLKPVHVSFRADEIVAMGTASDDEWFSTFSRKLEQELASVVLAK